MDDLAPKRGISEGRVNLDRIEAALDRLDLGTYGFCEICSDPIAIGRLERDPAVLVCGPCQAKH